MNFIMKFLQNKFVTKSDYMEGILSYDSNIKKFLSEVADNQGVIFDLSKRISVLEEKFSHTKIVLWNDLETNKEESKLLTTTNAIIRCLKDHNGKKLHYTTIYNTIKAYDLTNPNVELQSVKAILYQLARQKRIVLDDGTETGMFFIKNK